MPFIGNKPSNNFVSLKRQDITGDGTASYTLDYKVASVNDILVYVNHVKQDPSSMTVSGTSLTMGGNVASTDDFYVIFLGQALQTVTPADNTITNAMVSSSAAIATTKLGAGAILQVVSATDSTQRTTTSTSYVTASNTLSVDITPSSTSSKIFVIVSSNLGLPSGANGIATIFRDSTDLGNGVYGMARASASVGVPMVMSILDSPATTSQITYQVYIKETAAVANLSLNWSNTKGSITAIEIAG